jgi:ribosomal protein S27E
LLLDFATDQTQQTGFSHDPFTAMICLSCGNTMACGT